MSASLEIQVRNAQRQLRVDAKRLERFAIRAFPRCCGLPAASVDPVDTMSGLAIILVSDRRMGALHRQFMNIAGPTDVLTFQHGEIVISVETAQRNAKRFGTSLEQELQLYVVHGFLHLLGFNDKIPKDARAMAAAQERVLKACRASDVR